MITASWKRGMEGIFKADPNKIAAEISKIGEEVTPKQIVDYARDSNTELHKCFDWNDQSAAEKYRQYQARKVLQLLVIENHHANQDIPERRFFYKVDHTSGYKPSFLIFKNAEEYEKLLKTAMMELRAFKRKYSSLTELREILELIE